MRSSNKSLLGAVKVELALLLPLLLILTAGIVDFSMFFFAEHAVQNVVDRITREASVRPDFDPEYPSQLYYSAVTAALQQALPSNCLFSDFRQGANVTIDSPDDESDAPKKMLRLKVAGEVKLLLLPLIGISSIPVEFESTRPHEMLASTHDRDSDGVIDSVDNCSFILNSNQRDTDSDGAGEECDDDDDDDGILDVADNCRDVPNSNQADRDANGVGDACESIGT